MSVTNEAKVAAMSATAKPGDHCGALCERCKSKVEATYQLRDLPISGGGSAEGVLCIVCNKCGAVCGFHNSSLETVQLAVQRAAKQNPDLPVGLVEDAVVGKMEVDVGLVEEYKPEGLKRSAPNDETRAALSESKDIEKLERVDSIKSLLEAGERSGESSLSVKQIADRVK